MKITRKEQEILEVFWEEGKALSVKDVINSNPALNKNTVAALVKKLNDKGYLQVDSIQKVAKTFAQYYVPTISKEEYIAKELSSTTFKNLIANFIKKQATPNELKELSEMIQKQLDDLE